MTADQQAQHIIGYQQTDIELLDALDTFDCHWMFAGDDNLFDHYADSND